MDLHAIPIVARINDSTTNYIVERADLDHYKETRGKELWNSFADEMQRNGKNPVDPVSAAAFDDVALQQLISEVHREQQTTHDQIAQTTARERYLATYAHRNVYLTDMELKEQVMASAPAFIRQDKLPVLQRVIDALAQRKAVLYNLADDNEWLVLGKLWTYAPDENTKNNILLELADCLDEGGSLFCPTGIVMRLLSTMFCWKPEESPITTDVWRAEWLAKAAIWRKEWDEELPDSELSQLIKERLYKEYDGIVSNEKINVEVDTWFSS
jgi:hypothetical protein